MLSVRPEDAVLATIDAQRVLALEQGCVRIPSETFQEGQVADFFANHMESIGLEVAMVAVTDPFGSGKQSREPVGRLRGTGGGRSLMLNGHMDHDPLFPGGAWERDPFSGDFDGTWIYGRGAEDNKAGIVSAISAAETLINAGVRLKGDLLVCPVAAHKSGGFGTLALLKHGIKTDYAINVEDSDNGLATVTCGALRMSIHAYSAPTHPHSPAQRGKRYLNQNEQIARVIVALGPGGERVPPGGWLNYEPSSDLPLFPILHSIDIVSFPYEGRTTLEFELRTVPGMTRGSVSADVQRLIADLREENPNFNLELDIPPKQGKYGPGWDWPPVKISEDDPLPVAVTAAHRRVTGSEPVVGADPRLGNVGDASFLQRAGISSVLYGPGIARQSFDERVLLDDLLVAAKVYALTAIEICEPA